jgi:hypothetical protein
METKKIDKTTSSEKQKESGANIIDWLVSIFTNPNDPEREKRRLLKALGKDFQRVKYRFYKVKGVQALPALAKFFYEIYKVTSNASVILQGADKSQILKNLTIEFYFSDTQRELIERLSEDSIRERAKTVDSKALAAQLKDDMVSFFTSIDSQSVQKINTTYTLLQHFLRFINFDYYFVLKKFDSSMRERNFTSVPKFEIINGEYIIDDLKDFQEVGLPIDRNADWEDVLSVLKNWKNLDVVDRSEWTKLVNMVSAINSSQILTMIIQHSSQDPWFKPNQDSQIQRIVEPYMEKIRAQVEQTIQKILSERRDAQVDKLTVMVFGTKEVNRTKNYTDKANLIFSKKMSSGFAHTAPVNFTKAFLIDYFKKDIRELHELILIRGKWTTNVLSQQVSDNYYQILHLSDTILAFDDGLGEDKELGAKLRKITSRVVEKDRSTINSLKGVLDEINIEALRLVNEAAMNLITFGKSLKMILDDLDKKDHEIILNWKELEGLSETPLKPRIAEAYKKLYFFIQLIQVFLKTGRPNQGEGRQGGDIPETE